MPVYIIRAGNEGPVKIGYASNVEKRLKALQSANHEKLILLRVFENADDSIERAFHIHYAAQRLHGEWFKFTPEMVSREMPLSAHPIYRFFQLVGGYKAAKKALSSLKKKNGWNGDMYGWTCYNIPIPLNVMRKIEKITEGKVTVAELKSAYAVKRAERLDRLKTPTHGRT